MCPEKIQNEWDFRNWIDSPQSYRLQREVPPAFSLLMDCKKENYYCPYGRGRYILLWTLILVLILIFLVLLWKGFRSWRLIIAFALTLAIRQLVMKLPPPLDPISDEDKRHWYGRIDHNESYQYEAAPESFWSALGHQPQGIPEEDIFFDAPASDAELKQQKRWNAATLGVDTDAVANWDSGNWGY